METVLSSIGVRGYSLNYLQQLKSDLMEEMKSLNHRNMKQAIRVRKNLNLVTTELKRKEALCT